MGCQRVLVCSTRLHARSPAQARAGSGVRVGDLAQPGKDLPELPHAPLAEMLGPLGFDLRDDASQRAGIAWRPRSAIRIEPCAGIRRVRYALDIARPFQLIYEEAGGLLGDRCLFGKVGQPAAARRDALENPRLRRREVVSSRRQPRP